MQVQIHVLLAHFTDQALPILPLGQVLQRFWNMREFFFRLGSGLTFFFRPSRLHILDKHTRKHCRGSGIEWRLVKGKHAGNVIWQHGCVVLERCPSIWSHGRAQTGRMGFDVPNWSGELTAKCLSYFKFSSRLQKRLQRKQEKHILYEIRMYWASADSWAGFLGKLSWLHPPLEKAKIRQT